MPYAFPAHHGAPHEGRVADAPSLEPAERRIVSARRLPIDPDTVALEEADFLLSGGNGVTD
ncbi:MAG: hypothetical protein QNJ43_21940 [Breoghania sp.]|nr:hypothetical protein [Breoghania sp.]